MKTFYIQNMVCDRCKMVVEQLIVQNQAKIVALQLGRVVVETFPGFKRSKFNEQLKKEGFKLIQDPDVRLTESIKTCLLEMLGQIDFPKKFSDFLTEQLHKDYSVLAKTFKKIEGETIEKYFIKLKIEKVKEGIQMQEDSFSAIAYRLGYHSISHLSGQFKNVTGMTMSEYRRMQDWDRQSMDEIL